MTRSAIIRAIAARSAMIRAFVAMTCAVVVALHVFALGSPSQSQNADVIKTRQQVMKGMADATKSAMAMVRGGAPFNPATAEATMQTYLNGANRIAELFPPDSQSGAETDALPAVWERRSEFEARIAKFRSDVEVNLTKFESAEAFGDAIKVVGQNCTNCHETFRVKK